MVLGDKLSWRAVLRLHAVSLLVVFAVAFFARGLVYLGVKMPFTPVPLQIAGVSLAIFLAFRNSASYDRWWEGRKLWGGLVNSSRAFGRQATTLMWATEHGDSKAVSALQREIVKRQIAFVHALKDQLRGVEPKSDLSQWLPPSDLSALPAQKNGAAYLLQTNAARLAEATRLGWLSDVRLDTIDRTLTELIGLQGGCERIKNTPMPTAYRFFTHRFTRIFIVCLPFGLVDHLGFATIGASMVLAFIFLVLETIGRLLEDPFSMGQNGLALSAICRTIEVNLLQQLGDTDVPSLAVAEHRGPVDVLM